MKRIQGILFAVGLAVTLWVIMVLNHQESWWISKRFTVMLPLNAIVAYGLLNLAIVVVKIMQFDTYPQEHKSLLKDIQRARKRLKGKGVFDDE